MFRALYSVVKEWAERHLPFMISHEYPILDKAYKKCEPGQLPVAVLSTLSQWKKNAYSFLIYICWQNDPEQESGKLLINCSLEIHLHVHT